MAWVEESVLDNTWVEAAQGAFQRNAFQANAFQVTATIGWSKPDSVDSSWAEASGNDNTWQEPEAVDSSWVEESEL